MKRTVSSHSSRCGFCGSGSVTQERMIVLVTQSCLTLRDPMDCIAPGSSLQGFLQASTLEWMPFPPPGDLLNPGIEPGSPALQAESLPSEPPGK